jgi:mono/diheme cytochrome c family protein
MKFKLINALTVGAFVVGAAAMANAQQSGPAEKIVDLGKWEYAAHCAVCHGLKGAGEGYYSGFLTKAIPDLTTLSKRNGGVFPFARVYETIDGSQDVQAHGPRDMPIWGPRYKIEAGESFYDEVRANSEVFVRARILALTEYVYRLQAK